MSHPPCDKTNYEINSWASADPENAEIIHQNNGKPVIEYFHTDDDKQDVRETPVEITRWEGHDGQWEGQWDEGQQWEGQQWEGQQWKDGQRWENSPKWENGREWEDNQEQTKWVENVQPEVSAPNWEAEEKYKPELDKDCEHNAIVKEKLKTITTTTKGRAETIIHKPSHIIVNQPPTRVLIHHPPLIVRPAPVVLHRGGKTIHRPVSHQHLPRKVVVKPVYETIVKPIEKKILVDSKKVEKPGCDKKVIVNRQPVSGCDKTWIEHGEAYHVNDKVAAEYAPTRGDEHNWEHQKNCGCDEEVIA